MDSPASMRRVTRSQSAALFKKSKMQEVEVKRQPLFDISNDSPIAGLATKETPSKHNDSSIKTAVTDKLTLPSGESVLRCQVQTLMLKADEEKDGGFVDLADKVVFSSKKECQSNQASMSDGTPDNPELNDIGSTDSFSLPFMDTCQAQDPVCSSDDDCSSVWSLQVNACSETEELNEIIETETEENEDFELYRVHEEDYEEEEILYDLCKGMNGMCIGEETEDRKCANLLEFQGRHTKFVYNSEDEIEEQVIVLRGLPAPQGTHVHFTYEDDE